jgi:hypothetical protein
VNRVAGDSDSDGDVDGRDFMSWLRGFGKNPGASNFQSGDATGDRVVDGQDLDVIGGNFGVGVGTGVAAVQSAVSTEGLVSPLRSLLRKSGFEPLPGVGEVGSASSNITASIADNSVATDASQSPSGDSLIAAGSEFQRRRNADRQGESSRHRGVHVGRFVPQTIDTEWASRDQSQQGSKLRDRAIENLFDRAGRDDSENVELWRDGETADPWADAFAGERLWRFV